ncbi:MAG: Sugar O-acyltransferase [Rhodocyclales bacterium]|nr:Sugar O-acyltransferase [Rhodocyclales bacterium]
MHINTPEKTRKLIIVGDSAFAEIAHEYFSVDSDYEVVAFSVESAYLRQDSLHGLPCVAFEDIETKYAPADHAVFVAATYTQLNRLRTRLSAAAKAKGYALASYISSRSFIWRNVEIGEHCFIFEDNTVQPYVKIRDNNVLWSGNHIGHHSTIHENCFIASHAVVSGFCEIGANTFLGVNATIANNVNIGRDNWIGLGVTIAKSTPDNTLYKGDRATPADITTRAFFKIPED